MGAGAENRRGECCRGYQAGIEAVEILARRRQIMCEFSQGVCSDGAVILKDGQKMTIEEVLELLRTIQPLKDGINDALEWNWLDEDRPQWVFDKLSNLANT